LFLFEEVHDRLVLSRRVDAAHFRGLPEEQDQIRKYIIRRPPTGVHEKRHHSAYGHAVNALWPLEAAQEDLVRRPLV
jgi:hypothetical protein